MNHYKKSIVDAKKEDILDSFNFKLILASSSFVITYIIFTMFKPMPLLMTIVLATLIYAIVGGVLHFICSFFIGIKLNKEEY